LGWLVTVRQRKIAIGAGILVVAASVIFLNLYFKRKRGPSVQVETIELRDLVAIVSASGKIQPKRLVNISADTMGRVTELAVEEGEGVKDGQFLLAIDPEAAESAVQRGEAGLGAAREALNTARVAVETARANLELALLNQKRTRELHKDALVPQEALDRTESEVKVRRSELEARETEVRTQEQRLEQEIATLRSARHSLSKVTINSPMAGVITRLSIEEGETVLVGTMNNPGTVLMTVADLSVIQAELEVDETDIVDVRLGQSAEVSIDAFPDQQFGGRVTKIGSSATQPGATGMSASGDRQATNFEAEVTLEDKVPGVRPGFSCTADITTATRDQAIAVPIQALTVREVELNAEGHIVRESKNGNDNREELEGVFLYRDGESVFTPVKVGIAGERYFEVLSGLQVGDQVITGPYASVRELQDGDSVKLEEPDEE
jgi:HlyD family secretion protein